MDVVWDCVKGFTEAQIDDLPLPKADAEPG